MKTLNYNYITYTNNIIIYNNIKICNSSVNLFLSKRHFSNGPILKINNDNDSNYDNNTISLEEKTKNLGNSYLKNYRRLTELSDSHTYITSCLINKAKQDTKNASEDEKKEIGYYENTAANALEAANLTEKRIAENYTPKNNLDEFEKEMAVNLDLKSEEKDINNIKFKHDIADNCADKIIEIKKSSLYSNTPEKDRSDFNYAQKINELDALITAKSCLNTEYNEKLATQNKILAQLKNIEEQKKEIFPEPGPAIDSCSNVKPPSNHSSSDLTTGMQVDLNNSNSNYVMNRDTRVLFSSNLNSTFHIGSLSVNYGPIQQPFSHTNSNISRPNFKPSKPEINSSEAETSTSASAPYSLLDKTNKLLFGSKHKSVNKSSESPIDYVIGKQAQEPYDPTDDID